MKLPYQTDCDAALLPYLKPELGLARVERRLNRASDIEIVERSGILDLQFSEGDSVGADKCFTTSDILPLGVSLIIPPSRGSSCRLMPPEDVVTIQEIARLRIHLEHAINKIKNFHICDSVLPLNLWHCESNVVCLCIFLHHPRSNHIKVT